MLRLLRDFEGRCWCVDWCDTPEAGRIMRLFGSTVVPLPLDLRASPAQALEFARGTPAGKQYGVGMVPLGWDRVGG